MEEAGSEAAGLATLGSADLQAIGSEEVSSAAFQLFRDMDFDATGRLPAALLRNYLCGDTRKLISLVFDHPDTGIEWREDEGGGLSVLHLERDSPAALRPQLVRGLRLHSLQDTAIGSLRELYSLLNALCEPSTASLRFDFIVPLLTVSTFNQRLELEIDSELVVVDLPLGAVYDLHALTEAVNEQLAKAIGSRILRLSVDTRNRQFSFHSSKTAFKLLFARARSCCFLLGFDGRDTEADFIHNGEPMTTDINLGLPVPAVNLLISHLLFALGFPQADSHFNDSNIYDPEEHVFLTFEQFRLIFVNFLCDVESMNRLRAYGSGHFRQFRFKNHFNRVVTQKYERMKKRIDKQIVNVDVLESQRKRHLSPGAAVTAYQERSPADGGVIRGNAALETKWIERRRHRLLKWAERKEARSGSQTVQKMRFGCSAIVARPNFNV